MAAHRTWRRIVCGWRGVMAAHITRAMALGGSAGGARNGRLAQVNDITSINVLHLANGCASLKWLAYWPINGVISWLQ